MIRMHRSSVIDAPIGRVWDIVRDFNALPRWFPGVTESRIEPGKHADQIGCVRDFVIEGGPHMRERLTGLSDPRHKLSYAMVEGPLPVFSYVANVRLLPITDGDRTFIEIAAEFDCASEKEADVVALLGKTYQGAFDRLNHHFQANRG
jgi:uncharacterized protein YndB with AHSA1/START domain